VARVIARIQRHARGKSDDLNDIPIDLGRVSDFSKKVLRSLREVGPGQVITYGALANKAGRSGAARAVGRIMGANPIPLIVPCHRCMGSDGSLTGFSSAGGTRLKAKMLFIEGYERNAEHAAGIRHLRAEDRIMRRLIELVGPYEAMPDKPTPAYDTLVQAIIHQQLSVKAGQTIARRVRELTPGPRFPTPQELALVKDEALRGAGLSTQKVSYVRDLAARIEDGRLDLKALRRMDDESAIAALTTVRGIGRWTAQMHLLFHLGRLDVLALDDLGLRNAAGRAYGLGPSATAAQLEKLGETWRPYRSMASWYLWQAMDVGGL
jgi:methylated-DNA-[protein]-cysteine S-methyltransferase